MSSYRHSYNDASASEQQYRDGLKTMTDEELFAEQRAIEASTPSYMTADRMTLEWRNFRYDAVFNERYNRARAEREGA